jgi:flagellin-like protein
MREAGGSTPVSDASPDRAVSPVLGTALLVLVTVAVAAAAGGALLADAAPGEPPPTARVDCRADTGTERVACVHLAGDPLDVRELQVRVTVDGTPLDHQPPVPFFAARGFHGGPTGPFNRAADPRWTAGETAAFRVAGTNSPGLTPDARVVVTLVADGHTVARATATAA